MDTFKNFPSSALALLDCLLAVEPEHRGTASDALNSDFFTTKPYACDPLALPKYPPSKEFHAKLREEEAARKKEAAVKGLGSPSVRKGTGEYKAPEAYAEHRASLQQKRQAKSNPRSNSVSENYNTPDDVASGFLIDAPKRKTQNKITYSGPFIHPSTFEHSQSISGKLNGTQPKGHQSYMPSAGGGDLPNLRGLGVERSSMRSDINRDRNKQPHWQEQTFRFIQLDDAAASQKQDWWPSSSQEDEIIGPREPTSGYGARNNRIHYSGPLMPPGGNMEEMLKEHERHIQQAVRKARFEKAMSRKNPGEKGPFAAMLFPGRDGNLNV